LARPVKEGLDYFPFDVDFDTNEKTEAIMGEFGAKGTLIFIYLLLAIYRKGYFLQWTELAKNQIANRVQGATGELVQRVVDRLVAYGTFNKELFNSAEVLTSQRIQETYLDATKRRKSQKPTLYWINVNNNPTSSVVNVDINPQSKVNKSKVNKSKLKQHNARARKSNDADDLPIQKVANYYQQNVGVIKPLVIDDFRDYLSQFKKAKTSDDEAVEIIEYAIKIAVDNNKPSWSYASAVLKNWTNSGLFTMANIKAAREEHRAKMQIKSGSYGGQPKQEIATDYSKHQAKAVDPAELAELQKQWREFKKQGSAKP
jgi:DnaD/phage-associated family protein